MAEPALGRRPVPVGFMRGEDLSGAKECVRENSKGFPTLLITQTAVLPDAEQLRVMQDFALARSDPGAHSVTAMLGG